MQAYLISIMNTDRHILVAITSEKLHLSYIFMVSLTVL